MLPDSGQSKWTAILAGDQGSVCLHTAQLEGGEGAGQGSLSHTISFFQMKLISLSITVYNQNSNYDLTMHVEHNKQMS